MEESERIEVPGVQEHPSLALVDSEVRTGRGGARDELETPEALRAWLLERDLIDPGAELFEHCRGRIVRLRADLRELFAARATAHAPSVGAIEALNRALTSAPGTLLLHYEPATGFVRGADHPATQVIEHVMALMAEDAAALLSGEEGDLLALCGADGCERFYLRTHARRQWCSTRCGDRMRAARAYARRRSALART
ncbi:ABATE domain-containing protein [Brachybacterium sp. YJGR34]|uniref:CGNR zinc finger domain-containing protein n=1 Tax=Brachybacterium sp. YJGR34 TaxID=2059911 RepID=UPI000E0A4A06|nr:ABATE domain-containing protein [Brachybacterium sp. YJGR34]